MPTIRELVTSLRQRDGVRAVVVLGHDGVVIDGAGAPGVDLEHFAAHLPAVVAAADACGSATHDGPALTVIIELPLGVVVVSVLTTDVMLAVLCDDSDATGPLLFDVRRERPQMAAAV